MLFEFVITLLHLSLNKFLSLYLGHYYVTSAICHMGKSLNKYFDGVNFSLNKRIQNNNLEGVLKQNHV